MTTTTKNIDPQRCDLEGCRTPLQEAGKVKVQIASMTISVTLCDQHKKEWSEYRRASNPKAK